MKKIGLLGIMVVSMFACVKDSGEYIPSVPVNLTLPMSDPRINKLNSIGSAVTLSGYGVAGILLYRGAGGIVAFDRCSSYQPGNKCAVVIDDSGFTATDPCSGSKFLLSDGSPVKAPASKSLRQYDAYIDSGLNLHVNN